MDLIPILIVLIIALSFISLIMYVFFGVIERVYGNIFGKPIYIHLYPFPKKLTPEQLKILAQEFIFYQRLSDKKKSYFEHRVAHFINKHEFIGREDFVVTNQVKVLISATSCMLTFGMRNYFYKALTRIIVYPKAYYSKTSGEYHKGEFNPMMRVIAFSWEDFYSGYNITNDNLNLGIHEFGHALHFQGLKKEDISAALFTEMYQEITKEVTHKANRDKLIQSDYFRVYAYTNQFEFLAVILEHYFETPLEFKQEFPQLYNKVSLMLNHKH